MKALLLLLAVVFSSSASAGVQVTKFRIDSSPAKKAQTATKAPAAKSVQPAKKPAAAPAPKSVTQTAVSDHVSFASFESLTCPPGRITSTRLGLRYDETKNKQMDVTQADNILGYNEWNEPRKPYPYKQGFTIFKGYPRTAGAYIGAELVVPPSTLPNQRTLMYNLETIPGPGTDIAISTECGNFRPTARNCAEYNVFGGRAYMGTKVPAAPVLAACVLVTGRKYYENIRLTNPAAGGANCAGSTCQFGIQNNHTP